MQLLYRSRSTGQILLDLTFDYLELLERDFFGLVFNGPLSRDGAVLKWLDPVKKIQRQLRTQPPYTFWFRVKFYVPDPICLHEEYTRYQFFLQVRKDILEGRLPVSTPVAAHLAGLALQSEFGDFNSDDCRPGYVGNFRFLQQQTQEFESQASEWHRKLASMLPSAAELEFLNIARTLERYGVKTQEAHDEQDNMQSLTVGVSFAGITAFRAAKINHQYPWENILRILYKGRRFTIELKTPTVNVISVNGSVPSLLNRTPSVSTLVGASTTSTTSPLVNSYSFPSPIAAKAFWQYAVACHAFFRVREPLNSGEFDTNRGPLRRSTASTSISATAVYAAISRATSGFRRYFSISRRGSISSSGGLVSSVERTLSTVMELRRNSRVFDRGFSRASSRRSARRSISSGQLGVSFAPTVGHHSVSNMSLADRPGEVGTSNSTIKPYAQMPPGARSAAQYPATKSVHSSLSRQVSNPSGTLTTTASQNLHGEAPTTSAISTSRYHTMTSAAIRQKKLTGSDNLFSSGRPTALQRKQLAENAASQARARSSVASSPTSGTLRGSQRRPRQSPTLMGREESESPKHLHRPREPKVREWRPQPEEARAAESDDSLDETSEFNADDAEKYWNSRRTQAVTRPSRLPSKTREEVNSKGDLIRSGSGRKYHPSEHVTSGELPTGSGFTLRNSLLKQNSNRFSSVRAQASGLHNGFADSTVSQLKEQTNVSEIHSSGVAKITLSPSPNYIKDPFHPGAPAADSRDSPTAVDQTDSSAFTRIRIRPDSHGRFGFNVRGGSDHRSPIIISRVGPNMPADLCIPRLSEGDQVVSINGKSVAGYTHNQVVELIRSASENRSGVLELLVKPSDYVTDDPNGDNCLVDSGDAPPLPPRTAQRLSRLPSVSLDRVNGNGRSSLRNLQKGGSITNVNHNTSSSAKHLDAVDTVHPLLQSMLDLENGLTNGSLLTQFEQLPRRTSGFTMNASKLHENVMKNRYRDISPYDHTRVVLKHGAGDYINASFVTMNFPKVDIEVNYIAAQGPLPSTYGDFWQMCWEQRVSVVVMLTAVSERGRVKCHQYWPELGETLKFTACATSPSIQRGSQQRFSVSLQLETTLEETSDDFAHREFTITQLPLPRNAALAGSRPSEVRHVTQLQYISWPDHGVPKDSADFISFVERVRKARGSSDAPVVVHCSAGIGRTGVLIMMETAMNLMERQQPVRPIELVHLMRSQRALLIQTSSQFQFACETILTVFQRDYEQRLPK
ncbi:unnamed protein product [Calicophoron daubneyi]|uniref:protein-tyrosine-phosphatase n=1 Tax=Calicophoron daubneyi TaxID=300641 RepID=A0AAV2TMR0_CALDB